MPLISITPSIKLTNDKVHNLAKTLSKQISELTKKSESYVMVIIKDTNYIMFGGNDDPSLYVEVKSIGSLNPPLISSRICDEIDKQLDIPGDRVYISFDDYKATDWGFNSTTFG